MKNNYEWTDNPTVSGVSVCDTDILNECLMHLKYDQNNSGLALFDIMPKDHVLSYEESEGLAMLGSYVYKDSVEEFRYGYPEFYAKCLEEKAEGTATQTTLGSRTITTYNCANGHVYYDISDKDVVDEFYTTYGAAWYYGVDEANERIFLPRNNWFFQSNNGNNVGEFIKAGLPNITGEIGINNASTAAGAFRYKAVGNTTSAGVGSNSNGYDFDASRSSSIYGGSDTVQPNSVNIVYYMVVGNTSGVYSATVALTSDTANAPLNFDTETGALQLSIGDGLQIDIDGNLTGLTPELAAHSAMPSNRYEVLSIAASPSQYTAPADGYFQLHGHWTNNAGGMWLVNKSIPLNPSWYAQTGQGGTGDGVVTAPCRKGDVIEVAYSYVNNITLSFIYAEGAE